MRELSCDSFIKAPKPAPSPKASKSTARNALDLANDMQGPLSQERIEIVSGGKFSGGNVPKRGHAKFLGSGTGFRLALVVLARR